MCIRFDSVYPHNCYFALNVAARTQEIIKSNKCMISKVKTKFTLFFKVFFGTFQTTKN